MLDFEEPAIRVDHRFFHPDDVRYGTDRKLDFNGQLSTGNTMPTIAEKTHKFVFSLSKDQGEEFIQSIRKQNSILSPATLTGLYTTRALVMEEASVNCDIDRTVNAYNFTLKSPDVMMQEAY